jgi:crotonobetainyl-CoA:carnitine CoA-transferase CaiB-like acyl-CoA transferase
MLLGDLGARVIKIEEPGGGDEARQWGPPFAGGESLYFLALNRNKESVALDLKQPDGIAAFRRLAEECDVVIQNFRPGVAERLGIDYKTVRRDHPRLIYASISGFGLSGPDRQRPGYDLIIQAMSGMMVASGLDGEPVKACFPIADVLAGQFASQAILAALYERQRTGQGTHVEISLLESLLFAMSYHSTTSLLTGVSPTPTGTENASIVPYQLLRCKDRRLAIGVPNNRIWGRFCDALNRPDLADDERYRTNQLRVANRVSLIEEIEAVLAGRSSDEWATIFDQYEVPCGPLLSVAEVLQHRQMLARDNVVEVDHPAVGPLKLFKNPMRFVDRPMDYQSPPLLGQHTGLVLDEIEQTAPGGRW